MGPSRLLLVLQAAAAFIVRPSQVQPASVLRAEPGDGPKRSLADAISAFSKGALSREELEGKLSELKVAEVADVVEPHPSLEHPIAGYQLVIVPCDAPSAPPPEADVEADAFTATNASGVDLASVTDKSVAGKT